MSSIGATRIAPTVDSTTGIVAPTGTSPATAGDPRYITRRAAASGVGTTADNSVTVTATVTVTSGDASSTNPAFAGIYIQRYDASNHALSPVEWYLMGHRTTAGTIAVNLQVPLVANQRIEMHIKLLKRFTGDTTWDWQHGALKAEFITTFMSDRTPNAPAITSPSTGITLLAGANTNLEWTWSDPDDGSSPSTPDGQDYSGWQVQMRPGPTVADPDPAWTDPVLHSTIIGRTDPVQPAYFFENSEPYASWDDNSAYSILLLASTLPDTVLGSGPRRQILLSNGTWQFRIRGFDNSTYDNTRTDNSPTRAATLAPDGISPWSDSVTVYVVGSTLPPIPLSPGDNEGVYGDVDFSWLFQSPVIGVTQRDWQVFVREVGDPDYVQIGGGTPPDDEQTYHWVNGSTYSGTPFTMVPGHQYEWVAITQDTALNTSDQSSADQFWYVETPESGPELPLPVITVPDPGLGCGHNRAFVYLRGGQVRVGEITGITQIVWNRIRDDISSCNITIKDWSDDCGALLASVRSWQHEIVVFRDNGSGDMKRVWEGPITRPSYEVDQVTIEAKDVMGYVYRRILRQGYNDAYRKDSSGTVQGLEAVTNRSRKIIQNALAYDDPNVLAYLWVLSRADDAKESRVVPDWSRSAWQDIDDMAATAGLDYTTVGRRIMLWDTHNAIGTLPEMRDGDFNTPPVVTEYGMQLANVYGVTNNNGIWGSAERQPGDFYGYVEMLVSAWGESDGNGQSDTLTAEAAAALKVTLEEQADRGISQRWPTPLVVRVPDNSTLNPDLSIGINQLIPGVHIPLLSDKTLRTVRQTQKLDSIKVTETSAGEIVQVTMSPAPTSHDYDPDEDPIGDEGA